MAFIVKHYVIKALSSVCGEYVDGLSSDKLDFSLMSGEVTLRDLKVKPAVRRSRLLLRTRTHC
jgi:hypothetical protein